MSVKGLRALGCALGMGGWVGGGQIVIVLWALSFFHRGGPLLGDSTKTSYGIQCVVVGSFLETVLIELVTSITNYF